jgi:cob(I)alamin adenosyltransferase
MPRLNRIYTRVGDHGTTMLGSGRKVAKDSLRVSAYGTVDELNAVIGQALSIGLSARLAGELAGIQNRLFDLGADLATPAEHEPKFPVPRIQEAHVEGLENLIDELNEIVGPLENFILPGGSQAAACLHLARTVCRRAERELVRLNREEPLSAPLLAYINRLSDLLFVMARFENLQSDHPETLWEPGGESR